MMKAERLPGAGARLSPEPASAAGKLAARAADTPAVRTPTAGEQRNRQRPAATTTTPDGTLRPSRLQTDSALDKEAEDNELMLAYARGDATAFDTLYARHAGKLYQYVKRSCNHEALANELYQDIWLRVIKASEQYHGDVPFKPWLYRIASNRLTDHYRQNRRINALHSQDDPDAPSSPLSALANQPLTPEEIANLTQRADTLDKALKSLPANQRDALLMHHIAGMSLKEMAQISQQGVETLKSRLRYGSAKLRTRLRDLL